MHLRIPITRSRATTLAQGRKATARRQLNRGQIAAAAYEDAERAFRVAQSFDIFRHALSELPPLEPDERTRLVTMIAKRLDLTAAAVRQ